MATKRLSLKNLQASPLNEQQQLNTKGGFVTIKDKFTPLQTKFVIEDELDIRRPVKDRNSKFND